jgi:hypothetical protein
MRRITTFFILLCLLPGTFLLSQPNPGAVSPKSALIRNHLGKPTLFIDDEPVYPIIYAITDMPGGRWSWEEVPQWNLKQFHLADFNLYQVDVWLESLWLPDGTLDVSLAQRQIRGVLNIDPNASIMIRLHVNAPRWWQNQHPEECTQFADTVAVPQNAWGMPRGVQGDLNPFLRHSFASRKYLKDCGEKLEEFCQKFAKTAEGNSLVGLHIADGVFHEWHYWAFFEHYPDTGPAMTQYFSTWLKEKYKTDKALRIAWNDPQITFATATVPGKERLKTNAGVFRDPLTERKMIDYVEAQHESISDAVIHFCKITKENWPRPLITGVFYGYFFTMFGRQAAGGHLKVSDVLESPYVDYLSAPLSYQSYCRDLGGSGQSRGIIESCRLNGKLWLDEMDQTTTIDQDGENLFIKDLSGDVAKIRRNIAQSFTRGMGAWYYDFGIKTVRGWWGHPQLMSEIKNLNNIFKRYHQQVYASHADVLFVYDTDSYYYLGYDFNTDPVSPAAIDLPSATAYHSGAIFHMIYLHDIEKTDMTKYKVVVFSNTFYLTESQKKYIRKNVATDGRHIIWNYLPGYTNGKKLDINFVSDVTGISLKLSTTGVKPAVRITAHGFPETELKIGALVNPLPIIVDSKAVPLGYFEHDPNSVAFAVKELQNSTSWTSSIPLSDPAIFRTIFKKAGVHIYSDDGDVIYDGGGIFSVHTVEGGRRIFTLRNGKKVEVVLPRHSTTLFDSNTGGMLGE